jgi:hypothetical protein
MHAKYVLTGLFIAGFATPVLADYYVVQDATTKKCTVVTEKPKTGTSVKVLGTTIFKTESEAGDYVKKTKVCTSD